MNMLKYRGDNVVNGMYVIFAKVGTQSLERVISPSPGLCLKIDIFVPVLSEELRTDFVLCPFI